MSWFRRRKPSEPTGVFERVIPDPHGCQVPRGRYGDGTIWRCDCGQRWKSYNTYAGDGWMRMREWSA